MHVTAAEPYLPGIFSDRLETLMVELPLAADYSSNPKKRALQLEARAHIEVQRMVDGGQAPNVSPLSHDYILWTHREFCSRLPPELLWVEDPQSKERVSVIPGELCSRIVAVGTHVPPPPKDLRAFMERFEAAYRLDSKLKKLVSVAASHHRLAWIHPFLDRWPNSICS